MKEKIKDTLITGSVYIIGIVIFYFLMFGFPSFAHAEDPCWYTEGIPCEESL